MKTHIKPVGQLAAEARERFSKRVPVEVGSLPPGLLAELGSGDAATASTELVDRAIEYGKMGLHIFPCAYCEGRPLVNWWRDATTDTQQIAKWWAEHPRADIACAPALSGLFVLMFCPSAGEESLEEIEMRYGKLNPVRNLTGTWGTRLLFFRGAVPNSKHRLGPGTHTIGAGKYVFLAPSVARTREEAEG